MARKLSSRHRDFRYESEAYAMAEEKPNGEAQENERDSNWEGFKDYVKKMSQVPKEELDERLAEWERRRKGKRAG